MSRFTRAIGYFSLGFAVSLLINYWLRQEELRSQFQPYTPPKPVAKKAQPDDLTQITGIGPKTAEVLQAAGITTYAAIAAASPAELLDKLAGVRGVNREKVSAWIKQARKLSS